MPSCDAWRMIATRTYVEQLSYWFKAIMSKCSHLRKQFWNTLLGMLLNLLHAHLWDAFDFKECTHHRHQNGFKSAMQTISTIQTHAYKQKQHYLGKWVKGFNHNNVLSAVLRAQPLRVTIFVIIVYLKHGKDSVFCWINKIGKGFCSDHLGLSQYKAPTYQYMDSHYEYETTPRLSNLFDEHLVPGKTVFIVKRGPPSSNTKLSIVSNGLRHTFAFQTLHVLS